MPPLPGALASWAVALPDFHVLFNIMFNVFLFLVLISCVVDNNTYIYIYIYPTS